MSYLCAAHLAELELELVPVGTDAADCEAAASPMTAARAVVWKCIVLESADSCTRQENDRM